jgi:HEAT repeat protein
MTTCPTCGKTVDPLRARSVGVRDGKVVAFCSAECARAAESKPVELPRPELAVDKRTPATSETAVDDKKRPKSEPAPDDKKRLKSEPAPDANKRLKSAPAPDDKMRTPALDDKKPDDKKPDDKKPELSAKAEPESKSAKAEPESKSAKAERASKSAKAESERKRTPGQGLPAPVKSEPESGPVIEILHEPASGVVTSAPDRRLAKEESKSTRKTGSEPRGPFATGSLILESDDPDFEVEAAEQPRSRAPLVFLLLLLVAAGGGVAYYKFVYLAHNQQPAKAAQTPAPPPPPPPPPAIDATVPNAAPGEAAERANAVLRDQLRSSSPRVQRVAASALARIADPEAIAWLAAALAKETERAPKMDLAYALGRSGDKRGNDVLAQMLVSDASARLDIAKRLAQLHDDRAVQPLLNSLDVPQLRLSVAEYLVPFAEPHALKALAEIVADPKAPDRQRRATIALGLAGKAEVAPALREALANEDFATQAARALAELHDPAARPVLVAHLDRPTLRVEAARALRRLEPNLDPTPLLPKLVAALASDKDLERVAVAEAILVLTGPAAIAERE